MRHRQLRSTPAASNDQSPEYKRVIWRCPNGARVSESAIAIIAAGPCLSDASDSVQNDGDTVVCGGVMTASKELVEYVSSQTCTPVCPPPLRLIAVSELTILPAANPHCA